MPAAPSRAPEPHQGRAGIASNDTICAQPRTPLLPVAPGGDGYCRQSLPPYCLDLTVSPSAPHIDWLGISAAELQVSPAAARVTSNASKRAKKKAFGQVRRALIERPGVLEEVPSGWRVCVAVAGDERVFWVVRSWGSSRSWWVLAQPPEEPPPELLLAARSLLDAGWRVEPPFWKAGLWAAPPPAPPAAAPPEDVP